MAFLAAAGAGYTLEVNHLFAGFWVDAIIGQLCYARKEADNGYILYYSTASTIYKNGASPAGRNFQKLNRDSERSPGSWKDVGKGLAGTGLARSNSCYVKLGSNCREFDMCHEFDNQYFDW